MPLLIRVSVLVFMLLFISCNSTDTNSELLESTTPDSIAFFDSIQINSDKEYISLVQLTLNDRKPYSIQVSFKSLKTAPEKVFIVFSSEDEDRNSLLWEGYPISKNNIVKEIDSENLLINQGKSVKIFIWNKAGIDIQIKNLSITKHFDGNSFGSNKFDTLSKVLIFGHRATGTGVKNGFIENTVPAAREALEYADGIEMDIQMSSSNTLWMFHDDVYNHLCEDSKKLADSLGYYCILTTPDSIINKLKICRKGVKEKIYSLEELFELFSDQKYSDKLLSIDVKGYFSEKCLKSNNVDNEYLKTLGTQLYNLISKYKLKERIIIETNYSSLFEILKEIDPEINCFLLGYDHILEKAAKAYSMGLEGLSFNLYDSNLTIENIEKLKSKNLYLQLWTVKTKEEYSKALSFKPFSIQVSNIELIKAIQENKNQLSH